MIVVYTVGALGLPYTIVPEFWPFAGIVLVYGAELAAIQVVVVWVPSGITYSMVAGLALLPEASVVEYAEAAPPLVIVVYTVWADGEP